jgi:hypothetical protein
MENGTAGYYGGFCQDRLVGTLLKKVELTEDATKGVRSLLGYVAKEANKNRDRESRREARRKTQLKRQAARKRRALTPALMRIPIDLKQEPEAFDRFTEESKEFDEQFQEFAGSDDMGSSDEDLMPNEDELLAVQN